MAAVDKRGDDRASIGQIIHMLEGMDLSILAYRWPDPTFGATTLKQASADWQGLLQSDDFKDCKGLRDNAIAHTLMLPTPTVQYECYFRLHDAAEKLTLQVRQICGFGDPSFLKHHPRLTASAKVFWDTYFQGMAGPRGHRGGTASLGRDEIAVEPRRRPALFLRRRAQDDGALAVPHAGAETVGSRRFPSVASGFPAPVRAPARSSHGFPER